MSQFYLKFNVILSGRERRLSWCRCHVEFRVIFDEIWRFLQTRRGLGLLCAINKVGPRRQHLGTLDYSKYLINSGNFGIFLLFSKFDF